MDASSYTTSRGTTRDYLYISLGGNRGGPWRTYRNLMATMALGGLWHGAAWNFVAWGIYQGALLGMHRALKGVRSHAGEGVQRSFVGWMYRAAAIVFFFQVVCYGWLLFRASSFTQIVDFTARVFSGPAGVSLPSPPLSALLGLAFLLFWDLLIERSGDVAFYAHWPIWVRAGLYAGMIYLLAFGATTQTSAFIYFQF